MATYKSTAQDFRVVKDGSDSGISDIKPYYAVGTSSTTAPSTPSTDKWSESAPTPGSSEYLWCAWLTIYSDGATSWSTPYCMTDVTARERVSTLETELAVVQGQITSKVWQTDIETAVSDIDGQISTLSDNYTYLSQTVDTLNAEIGSVSTKVSDNYEELTSKVTTISGTVDGITTTVSDLQTTVDSDHETFTSAIAELQLNADTISASVTSVQTQVNEISEGVSASLVLTVADGVGVLSGNADYISLTGGQIAIDTSNFSVDINGNAYFSGTLEVAGQGTIAGFTIGDTAIYSGASTLTSSDIGIYLGIDGIMVNAKNNLNGYVDKAVLANGYLGFYKGSDYALRIGNNWGEGKILNGAEVLSDEYIGIFGTEAAGGISLGLIDEYGYPTRYYYLNLGTNYSSSITQRHVFNDSMQVSGAVTFGSTLSVGSTTAFAENTLLTKSSASAMYYATRSDTGVQVGLGVSTNGTTHGVYSSTLSKWLIYGDENNSYAAIGSFTYLDYGQTDTGGTTYRRPIASAATATSRVALISSSLSGSTYRIAVNGQYGSSNYASNYFYSDASSDIRLKENIADTEVTALPVIRAMQMCQFDWKSTGEHQDIGVIADWLEEQDPGFVCGGGYDENGDIDPKAIKELYLSCYLIKAVQELADQVDELTAKVDALSA